MRRRVAPQAGRSARAEYERRLADHKAKGRTLLPRRILVIGGVTAVAWLAGGKLLESLGLFGYGWVVGLFVFLSVTEPILDARKRINAWSKGSVGEEKTERWLRKLPSEFVVLHDLAIPGSKANIDHLVIGPTGVFVVDTKNYKWKVTENRTGELWSGKYPMARAIEAVNWEATKVAEALGAVEVGAILCVLGAELPRRNIVKNGVMLAGPRGTLRILQEGQGGLVPSEVEKLAAWARSRLARM